MDIYLIVQDTCRLHGHDLVSAVVLAAKPEVAIEAVLAEVADHDDGDRAPVRIIRDRLTVTRPGPLGATHAAHARPAYNDPRGTAPILVCATGADDDELKIGGDEQAYDKDEEDEDDDE